MKMQTIQRVVGFALIAFAAIALVVPRAEASAAKIDADVHATLDQFFRTRPGARELANNAAGVLVFPTVVKAGIGIGGEYGEGALFVGGRPTGYYNLVSASFGFQFGAQARTVIIMFMTPSALAGFNRTAGWKVGVDGSVTLITLGAGRNRHKPDHEPGYRVRPRPNGADVQSDVGRLQDQPHQPMNERD